MLCQTLHVRIFFLYNVYVMYAIIYEINVSTEEYYLTSIEQLPVLTWDYAVCI